MKLRLVATAFALLTAAGVQAHDPGLSALLLQSSNSVLRATVTLACADAEALVRLDLNRDGTVGPDEFEQARPALEQTAGGALEVSVGGVRAKALGSSVQIDASGEVQLHQSFVLPVGPRLQVRSPLLGSLPRGHRQYAVLRDSDGRPLGDKLLDATQAVFEAPLAGVVTVTQPPCSLGQFLFLGVEHIATGYDHLVFLLGLLVVGGSLRASAKIITAFTIAHSITLALATLELIRLPSSVVEPLIAVSIMYVGVENLLRRDLDKRWRLAFAFGLIHGCGFASVLRELGIGANGTGVAAPLLSFNLGVELGQLALAALILPAIGKLNRRESYQLRYVPTCSLSVTLAGAYWFAERVLPMLTN
jgi:hydrogenase/urease accessory protein HupE